MARRDADVTHRRGREHHRGLAVIDVAFGTHDVNLQLRHLCLPRQPYGALSRALLAPLERADYYNFFAFSTASSIVPTM